jgi:cytochrome c-type biogenesis protein CcmF
MAASHSASRRLVISAAIANANGIVVATFLLSILGTFITRSGIIESVHSFSQSPIGNWFAGFLVLSIVTTAVLVTTRLKDLEARAELESMVSREAAFLYNNVVLVGIAFSVLWGTLFPIISEAVRGSKITVGPPFFNTVNIPLGLLLLGLTGVGPLIAWRRASVSNLKRQFAGPVAGGLVVGAALFALGMRDGYALVSYTLAGFVMTTIGQEFLKGIGARRRMHGEAVPIALMRLVARNRRRYGGYIVHFGIVVLFAAFAGLAFKKEYDLSLAPGASFSAVDPYNRTWTFTSQGVSRYEELNRQVTAVVLEAKLANAAPTLLKSEKRQHVDSRGNPTFEPSTEVGILESLRQDVYLVLHGVTGEETAEIRITFNPLVWWVWYGGIIMAIGGLIVMWPQATPAGAKRKAEGGYVVVMQPSERPPVEAGV